MKGRIVVLVHRMLVNVIHVEMERKMHERTVGIVQQMYENVQHFVETGR